MSKTLTVEADMNAVDTLTNLVGQGSVAAPSRVTPADATRITGILAAVGADSAAEGSAVFLLRISGPAIKNGEQTLVFAAAAANTVQAGGDAAPVQTGLFKLFDVDMAIEGSEVIDVAAEMMGEDLGDSTVVVTLIME